MDKAKIDKMSGPHCNSSSYQHNYTDCSIDEQIAQMYELMQAIRKQELEDNDPEFQAAIGKDPSKQE
jgi:hypothetical protein